MCNDSQSPGRNLRGAAAGFRRRCAAPLALTLLWATLWPVAAVAQPAMPIDPEGNLQDLTQMKYCQWVLAHPENRSRVYDYDTRRCQVALDTAWANMAWMGEQARDRLAQKAEQQARSIQIRTKDVTQVIRACRQACEKLTPDYDQEPAKPDAGAPTDGAPEAEPSTAERGEQGP